MPGILKDLFNSIASFTNDVFIGKVITAAQKSETVQLIMKKIGVDGKNRDFTEHYTKTIVEFRFLKKHKAVIDFFRDSDIMQVFYDVYYGEPDIQWNEPVFIERIKHFSDSLKAGEDVKEAGLDIMVEAKEFWTIFRGIVHEGLTLGQVEFKQILIEQRKLYENDIQKLLSVMHQLINSLGKTQIEADGQVVKLEQLDVKFLAQILGRKTIHLTPPPFLPEIFLGREEELQAIKQKLSTGNRPLLLVNGEGGVGKTSLAAQYYDKCKDNYTHIAWVLSEKNIGNALLLLAQPLGISFDEQMPTTERLGVLLKEMASLKEPCLLVIDNANEADDLGRHYQRLLSCSNFHILLTSRITEFEQAEYYHINGLPEDDALALFKRHYKKFKPEEESLFKQIRTAVGDNTLVIELLAKNLSIQNKLKTKYELSDLLNDLQEKGVLGLTKTTEVTTGYHAHEGQLRKETPEDIIGAMYDLGELTGEETALLSVFAVLPAENISFNMLETLLPNHERLEPDLTALSQKGWIEFNTETNSFKCSPVIQEITRKKNEQLANDCEPLIVSLANKLLYQPGTGHLENATYEEAFLLARYAESVIGAIAKESYNLSVLCERNGSFFATTGNLHKALKYYVDNAALSKRMLEQEPANELYKNGLAIAYSKLGETWAALGELHKALQFYEDRNRLGKELYEEFPGNVSFKNGLAISYSKLGETWAALGELHKALQFYEDGTVLFKELYEEFPGNVSFKNGLAISYSKLGETWAALGELHKALQFYEDDAQLTKELYEEFPGNVSFKNGLAISYEKLGETWAALGELHKALQFYEDRNRLGKELYEEFPGNVSFKNGLAISYEKLGKTWAALGDLHKALQFYEDRNSLTKELYEEFPGNVSFKNGLAVSYSQLGRFYRGKQTDVAKAKTYFGKCYQLWKELSETFPNYVEFKRYFEWAKNAMEGLNDL